MVEGRGPTAAIGVCTRAIAGEEEHEERSLTNGEYVLFPTPSQVLHTVAVHLRPVHGVRLTHQAADTRLTHLEWRRSRSA